MANSYYQRKATIEWKKAKTPNALKRAENTDYTSGYFFVTLNVHEHKPLLSTLIGHVDELTAHVSDVSLHLSPLGERVQDCWLHVPEHHPNVQIIDCVLMPEHFHGLIHIYPREGESLSEIIRGFKIGCYHIYKELYPNSSASLFSEGFNETTPITAEDIETKKQYIHDNPRRRLIKEKLRDLFAICHEQRSPHWAMDRITQGLCHDSYLANHTEALQSAIDTLRPRLMTDEGQSLTLDYVGNRDLLQSARKLPLICHRADAEHFAEQSTAVIRAAQDGAIIVSAFISTKEREVLKELIAIGSPVIEIMDNGFSKTYKPWGNSFYACAESKLLQITPWNYLYQKDFTITRPMCMVMNELVRIISDMEDDWWKK